MNRILLASLVGTALLAGCTLAPEYRRPEVSVSTAWPTRTVGETQVQAADQGWAEFFADPRLQRLIDLALKNNQDLKVAALRVEQLRSQYRIQNSALYPGVEGYASRLRQRNSGAVSDFNGGSILSIYSANLTASYELDLFGRVRSLKREALELYLATEEARRSVHLALVSEVAAEYLTQLRLREAKAVANRTLETVQASLELIRRRFEVGAATELEWRTAEGQVQAVKVNAAAFLQQLAESENALTVLIGQPLPADLPAGIPFAQQRLQEPTPAGIPSEALQRRPDLLAAEHVLRASKANIGAARAAFFPRIFLTGSGGTASAKLSDLFTGPSETWSFMPQITVPIFDVGGTRARVAASKVASEIEVARYQKTIQTAFRAVADALATRAILEDKVRAQERLLESQRKRFELTEARYRQGVDSYVDVLLAQQDLYAAQQNLLQFLAARLLNAISLYRSLGGGWKS